MKEISIKFAELHNALFLGGTNHQMKLDPSKRQGMKLHYDRAEKELIVEFNGHVAIVPSSNVASMTLSNPKDIGVTAAGTAKSTPQTHINHPVVAGIDRAQVSDPTRDVVFGVNAGQVGQDFGKSK
jgi:hypothetical protein